MAFRFLSPSEDDITEILNVKGTHPTLQDENTQRERAGEKDGLLQMCLPEVKYRFREVLQEKGEDTILYAFITTVGTQNLRGQTTLVSA